LKALALLFFAVGKMNFVFGKREGKVWQSYIWEVEALRSSGPKFGPDEPRPWSRMRVEVWVESEGMMRGGG
jgi:hypothetical protein